MDIDMSALRGLVREKEISFDLLVEAIESALLIAYHRTEGSRRRARVELDRNTGHVTVWAKEDPEDLEEGAEPRDFDDTLRFRPDRGDHRQAGHPAAAAGRRGGDHLRRVRRA